MKRQRVILTNKKKVSLIKVDIGLQGNSGAEKGNKRQ